jgi:histone deacetylase 6
LNISGVVNFVTGSLRPVKSDVDQELSAWYRDNSRVFVANDHACWEDPDLNRKVNKRRFGAVKRSPVNGLNRMMREHATDVQQWIMGRVAEGHGDTTEEEQRWIAARRDNWDNKS